MTFVSIWKFGGQMQRIQPDATAFGDRSMPFMLSLDAIWSRADDDSANIEWVRAQWKAVQCSSTGCSYLNFPGFGEGEKLVRDALGVTAFDRLLRVKQQYDPTNVFRLNQNIS